MRPWNVLSLIALSTLSPVAASAAAGDAPKTGTVSGTLTGAAGAPLPYASVLVLGETAGSASNPDGTYTLHLPPGPHTLKFAYIGYETAEQPVTVTAGATVVLHTALREAEAPVLETITVLGRRERIRREDSSSRHTLTRDDLASLPVDGLQEAVALKAGVVESGGKLHFRGGRDTEVQYRIDGIPVNDPLLGRGVAPATVSVAESEILTGGFDAEYGNAQSGIVDITTREGGDRFAGSVTYMTDDFGGPDRTYDNTDRLGVGFGGPLFSPSLRYFVSGQGAWTDTYLKTSERRPTHTLLDLIRFRDRQDNDLQVQGKLTWLASPDGRLSLEWLRNRRSWDEYDHRFSREGWRSIVADTLDTGEIRTEYGDLSPFPQGPGSVYYDAAEHVPDHVRNFEQGKAVWTQVVGAGAVATMRLSHHGYDENVRVLDKEAWEYDGPGTGGDGGLMREDWGSTFVDLGDTPFLSRQSSRVWSLRGDLAGQAGAHRFKTGAAAEFNHMTSDRMLFPGAVNSQGTYGLAHDDYTVDNLEASCFAQDRWEHEGMVLNLGLRLDAFDAGSALTTAESRGRYRTQLSPRLGVAYPVSDRDALSFHYGRFSQTPPRHALYDFRATGGGIRGNLDLQNETTVGYQASLQHRFSETVFGQFAVYHKEIFGLLGVEQRYLPGTIFPVNRWTNRDYASSRGFELSLARTFRDGFSGELSYTYGVATGVASDPAQDAHTDFLYLPNGEQPLDWDQRHTLAATLEVAAPGRWSVRTIWRMQSGLPYTPVRTGQRSTDPAAVNSARLPGSSTLTLQAEKHYRVWGQAVRVFLRADNLLDARTVAALTPAGAGPAYAAFYTETGRAGGGYLGADADGDGNRDWVPLSDPRVFGEGRAWRVGASVAF